jgi:hypothetical protein
MTATGLKAGLEAVRLYLYANKTNTIYVVSWMRLLYINAESKTNDTSVISLITRWLR